MEPNDGLNNKQDDIKETVSASSDDGAVISSTGMTQPVAQEPVDNNSDNSAQDKPKKKNRAIVTGMILLAILAVSGVGFGIYAWATALTNVAKYDEEVMANVALRNQLAEATQVVEEDTTVIAIDEKEITNELAQNLINPYMGAFTYLEDIFDHDFNENTKFYVAFSNMDLNSFHSFGKSAVGADTAFIRYDDVNGMYKYLFGEGKDLDKVSYQEGYNNYIYTDEGGSQQFRVERLGGGGTMAALFSIIKEAYYTDDGITVEVYHDKINVCVVEGADQNYCVKEMGYHTVMDEEMEQIISKNSGRIPVYNMIFKNAGDHYYLNAINKQ